MKLSIPSIDEIEIRKRCTYHKIKKDGIANDPYKNMNEKCFELRQVNIRFNKSLNKEELRYAHSILYMELTGEEL